MLAKTVLFWFRKKHLAHKNKKYHVSNSQKFT